MPNIWNSRFYDKLDNSVRAGPSSQNRVMLELVDRNESFQPARLWDI